MASHDPDCINVDEDYIDGNCEIDCRDDYDDEDYDELYGRDDYKDYE